MGKTLVVVEVPRAWTCDARISTRAPRPPQHRVHDNPNTFSPDGTYCTLGPQHVDVVGASQPTQTVNVQSSILPLFLSALSPRRALKREYNPLRLNESQPMIESNSTDFEQPRRFEEITSHTFIKVSCSPPQGHAPGLSNSVRRSPIYPSC